jgi:CBS domain-containing protein
MASNKIVTRVKDFLKEHPPFSFLPESVLLDAAESVEVMYFQHEDYIFNEGTDSRNYAFVLKKGEVEMLKQFEEGAQLIDVCEEGDVFGVRSLMTGNPYLASARAKGDALVYAIPRKVAKSVINEHPKVALFFAAGFASGQVVIRGEYEASQQARKDLLHLQKRNNTNTFNEEDVLMLNPVEDILSCTPDTTIREAAVKMRERRVGSIIVLDENRLPIGMVTDTDFTRKVIVENMSTDLPVSQIMSSPVITLAKNTTVAQFTIRSIRRGIRRIVITEDGTNQSPVVGVVSDRDVLSMTGNNPAVIVKRMLKARSIKKLKELRDQTDNIIINYLEQEVSMEFIAEVVTEINDALIERAIDFSLRKMKQEGVPDPKLRWVWMSLGSEGRGEQLLRTDQDNAILYEDPTPEKAEMAERYFLSFGKKVVDILIECGFAPCKGEIMASNPKWTQPLSGWKEHFRKWIQEPEPNSVMHGNIFFDFRNGYGDATLTDELSEFIFKTVERSAGTFARFFVKDATDSPPPLSFFKNFIVERSGDHKDMFDIKSRAMMPLAGAARMLVITDKLKGVNNTFERYRRLAELHPTEQDVFKEAAMAYEIFMRYRAIHGFRSKSSGRFIRPSELNKIERQTLRTAFQSIEDVQRHLKFRFNLMY